MRMGRPKPAACTFMLRRAVFRLPFHFVGVFGYALTMVDANPMSPVPEPTSYALMLAGLGFGGLKARRSTH